MTIAVTCPECDYSFAIPDEYGGKKGRCPECQAIFISPESAEPVLSTPSRVVSEKASEQGASSNSRTSEKKARSKADSVVVLPPSDENDSVRDKSVAGEAGASSTPAPPPAPPQPKKKKNNSENTNGAKALTEKPTTKKSETGEENAARQTESCEAPPLPPQPPQTQKTRDKVPSAALPRAPISSQRDSSQRNAGRPSQLPMFIALGVVALFALGVLGGGLYWYSQQEHDKGTAETKKTDTPVENPEKSNETATNEFTPALMEKLTGSVRPALLRVYASGDGAPRVGAGFVVDSSGLAVTNWSLLAGAQQVAVVTPQGDNFRVHGWLAKDEDADLAVIKIDALPPGEPSLSLSTEPIGASLAFIEGAQWNSPIREVEITGKVTANRLPSDLARSVSGDATWLEHSAPTPSEVAGLPLIDRNGKVAAINSGFGLRRKLGYAIDVTTLSKMLADVDRTATGRSFQNEAIAAVIEGGPDVTPKDPADPKTTDPVTPDPVTPDPVPSDPTATALREMRELREEFTKLDWVPFNEEQSIDLQKLARLVTEAKQNEDDKDINEAHRLVLSAEAEQTLEILRDQPWPRARQISEMNQMIGRNAIRGRDDGVFLFGRIVNVSAEVSEDFGNRRLMLVELIGEAYHVALPISSDVDPPEPGSEWLILGVNVNPGGLIFQLNDGVLDRKIEPLVVEATHLLARPKAVDD